mgnify:FL=1|tara:strand:- start:3052 stop:3426 length:375 start_codon:yes stop_codon:yes gene_type:complete
MEPIEKHSDYDYLYNTTITDIYITETIGYLFILCLIIPSCKIACTVFDVIKEDYKKRRRKKKLFKNKIIVSKNNLLNDCTICLEPFRKQNAVIILSCDHKFHENCIKLWLNKNNSCPLCRENII